MDKFVEALKEVGQKLGQGVETLWPHAVRYVAIQGLSYMLTLFSLAGVSFFVGKALWDRRIKDEPEGLPVLVILWVGVVIGLWGGLSYLPRVLEPTGYLVENFIEGVRR